MEYDCLFLAAFVQNVQKNIRKRPHTFVFVSPITSAGAAECLTFIVKYKLTLAPKFSGDAAELTDANDIIYRVRLIYDKDSTRIIAWVYNDQVDTLCEDLPDAIIGFTPTLTLDDLSSFPSDGTYMEHIPDKGYMIVVGK